MSNAKKPNVLIVDDREDINTHTPSLEAQGMDITVCRPDEVSIKALEVAQLVLVDYQLDDWDSREDLSPNISLQPRDGLALATVLRRHVHDREGISPTAFAILSGKLDLLASPLPPDNREHALARLNNLEWVFGKQQQNLSSQVFLLANAVMRLPNTWPDDYAGINALVGELLGVDWDSESELLVEIERCRPPMQDVSTWSHGLAIIRWLLHRILPYPCFLWSDHYLAARLCVDLDWLVSELASERKITELFQTSTYSGVLAGFNGRRWWRARIESALWEVTGGASFDTERLHAELASRSEQALVSSGSVPSVVCVNTNYAPFALASIEQSARIQPDDWPVYADPAWTTRELAKGDEHLKSIVVQEDKDAL